MHMAKQSGGYANVAVLFLYGYGSCKQRWNSISILEHALSQLTSAGHFVHLYLLFHCALSPRSVSSSIHLYTTSLALHCTALTAL